MNLDPCIFCNREITNPVCASCNFKHVALWLNERSLKLAQRNAIVRRIRILLFLESENELPCLICKKNEVCVCSYCFFDKVCTLLESLNVSEESIKDFKTLFNYEIYSDYAYLEEELEELEAQKLWGG